MRYDLHGKRLSEQNQKYCFADHGLRNSLCGFNIRGGIEKVIENVVWNHLLGQGFKVTSFSGEMAEEKFCFRAAFLVL
ncbi:MAG: hypothetical protein K2O66_06210 [Bacteroidales bacterium]|nr:hypothetical protein [Bacteroidales bacterium]MDE7072932.1 hypothetical protein [Bacteroidales bacterium]